jgi:hypothetical protein
MLTLEALPVVGHVNVPLQVQTTVGRVVALLKNNNNKMTL